MYIRTLISKKSVCTGGILSLLVVFFILGCVTTVHLKQFQDIRRSAIEHDFSGVIFLAMDDTIILHEAFGYADRKENIPNTIDTRFAIASITKQFTGATLVYLLNRGLLDLDDPITYYFSDFPRGAQISINDLASHRSGLTRYLKGIPLQEDPLSCLSWTEKMIERSLITYRCKPGERFSYSNAGYNILSAVIERVSGKPYSEVVIDMISDPNIELYHPHDQVPKKAKGYFCFGVEAKTEFDDTLILSRGSSGIFTRAIDLYNWYRMLRDNQELFTAVHERIHESTLDNYALGWRVSELNGSTWYQHGGQANGFASMYMISFDTNTCLVILSNRHWRIAEAYIEGLAAGIRDNATFR
ncbi:MAG: beta-lactamase family protein [Syntrophaceae bacterium]|nr:beta-lactamase family protein [Syntrophaceae bacterium]